MYDTSARPHQHQHRQHDAVAMAIGNGALHAGNISAALLRRAGMADHQLKPYLDHGRKVLAGADELAQYLWSYGRMVNSQWAHFFTLHPALPNGEVHLVDYGCGQGLGMANVLDRCLRWQVTGITLVEPSTDALARARAVAGLYLPQVACNAINTRIQHIGANPLPASAATHYLHLFSNVLDITGFQPDRMLAHILRTPGMHTLWAVSHDRDHHGGTVLAWQRLQHLASAAPGLQRYQQDNFNVPMSDGRPSPVVAWQIQLTVP